jgi:glutaredoxin
VLGGLAAAIFVVTGGVVAYRAVVGLTHPAIASEPQLAHTNDAATTAAPATPAPIAAEAPTGQGESIPFDQPLPPPVAPALAELPAAKPAAPSAASAPTAAPVAPARPAPTPAELQAAFAATPIQMYSASWCGVCRRAHQFFADNGLRVQEIDVDQTPGAWQKVEQQTGRRAVPLIIVDGHAIAGLSPNEIMRAVASSMERRLGITGITFKKS